MKALQLFFLLSALGISSCQPASKLAGTSWKLILYGDLISPRPVLPAEPPTLEFNTDGRFAAQTGCNRAGGNYQETGKEIYISDLISTLMVCADTDRAAQESAYVDGLYHAQEFTLKDNQLTIYYANRTKALTFSPMP